jgi:hypothetical protein
VFLAVFELISKSGTAQNGSERLRTAQNNSGQLRTTQDNPGSLKNSAPFV